MLQHPQVTLKGFCYILESNFIPGIFYPHTSQRTFDPEACAFPDHYTVRPYPITYKLYALAYRPDTGFLIQVQFQFFQKKRFNPVFPGPKLYLIVTQDNYIIHVTDIKMNTQNLLQNWSNASRYKLANTCDNRLPIGIPTSYSLSSKGTSPGERPGGRPKGVCSQSMIPYSTFSSLLSLIFFARIFFSTRCDTL